MTCQKIFVEQGQKKSGTLYSAWCLYPNSPGTEILHFAYFAYMQANTLFEKHGKFRCLTWKSQTDGSCNSKSFKTLPAT